MLCILTPWWPCQNTTISSQGTTPPIPLEEQWWLALAHWIKGGWLCHLALARGYISSQLPTNAHTVDSSSQPVLPSADDGNAVFSGANGCGEWMPSYDSGAWVPPGTVQHRVHHLESTVISKRRWKPLYSIFYFSFVFLREKGSLGIIHVVLGGGLVLLIYLI